MKRLQHKAVCICSLIVVLLVQSCTTKAEKNESQNQVFDQTDNWIVLEKTDATKEGTTFSWDFNVKHPAEYLLHIVTNADSFQEKETVSVKLGL
jgi:alpha-L-fucosidase